MENTLGKKIADLRKEKGIKQDDVAEILGVSPQAVSKWENDISCPDIMLLPKLANLFGVTVDELLSNKPKVETKILPEEERKNIEEMMFRVYVNTVKGDKVRVNLPMPLVKMGLELGMKIPQISGNGALQGIDFAQLIQLVEKGVIGKLVEVESEEGDIVEIVVE